MLKLFTVLLGGEADGCNIELHDVVFTVGKTLEETYPLLVNKWFGIPKGLHVDSSIEVNMVDGYEIVISDKPCQNDMSLFFINMGGYRPNKFGEVHEVGFFVCKTLEEAKERAKKEILSDDIYLPHCDDKINVTQYLEDDIIEINSVDKYYIHLRKSANMQTNIEIISDYRKLDIPEIRQAAINLQSSRSSLN